MSALYNLEPQPTAKVLLQTTYGDILLELFAKQTPLASRNFLQHCLDGYYDNTIFHRLVPGFIVQGGDPTGTGSGGESSLEGGVPFADEFHSRLKYNRRGLLGMANTGPNDNGSQFFLTLGETPELAGKNTLFGRVAVGDTIYNLMKLGEADLAGEGSERPLYPAKITGTEILVNPFEDLVKRERIAHRIKDDKTEKKKPKRKAGKALLSFGGEEGEDADAAPVVKKPKFNTKLISVAETELSKPPTQKPPTSTEAERREEIIKSKAPPKDRSPSPPAPAAPATKSRSKKAQSRSPSPSTSPEPQDKSADLLARTNAEISALKQSMKRNVATTAAPTKKKSALDSMIPATATRGRKRRPGGDDTSVLKIINSFKKKLDKLEPDADATRDSNHKATGGPSKPTEKNGDTITPTGDNEAGEAGLCDLHFIANCQSCSAWDKEAGEEDVSDNDLGWMSHALSFEKDRLGKDLEWKRKNEEELVVIDPREKAKELGIERDPKEKGRREWNNDRRGGGRGQRQDDRGGQRGGGFGAKDRDRRR